MEACPHLYNAYPPLNSSLNYHRPSFPRPISSVSFRTNVQSLLSLSSLKSSSFSYIYVKDASPPFSNIKTLKPELLETLKSRPFSLLRSSFIAAVTITALFLAGLRIKPAIATSLSLPPTVDTNDDVTVNNDQNEIALEKHLDSHPDDVEALGRLMEIKTQNWKVSEAISLLERLMRLEPDFIEWPLLKAHLHCNAGELEQAKVGFSKVLERDPLRVEAYHGLLMAAIVSDSSSEVAEVEKRLCKGIELCNREAERDVLTSLKLFLAQIRVLEGKYDEGLKIYQALVEEEPRDFRPYLCQGIIYTLLNKKKEAEECLENFRKLVPEGHPFEKYLDTSPLFR